MSEINKLKIEEFQKEIETLKISHGNPAKRPRSNETEVIQLYNQNSLLRDIEPILKKITSNITKTIIQQLKTNNENKYGAAVKQNLNQNQTRSQSKSRTSLNDRQNKINQQTRIEASNNN